MIDQAFYKHKIIWRCAEKFLKLMKLEKSELKLNYIRGRQIFNVRTQKGILEIVSVF